MNFLKDEGRFASACLLAGLGLLGCSDATTTTTTTTTTFTPQPDIPQPTWVSSTGVEDPSSSSSETSEDTTTTSTTGHPDTSSVLPDFGSEDDLCGGKIDVLLNNVGIAPAGGPLDIDDALFQRTMDINVGSILRTTRAVLPHFLKQGSGVITNISSLASIRWSGYSYFAYYASKAALNQATVATALEFADKGIRANAILPGVIDTPLVYQQIAAQYDSIEHIKEQRANAVPMKRTGTPWDIANAAVFLASDAAGFITGVCLPVDAGHSCAMPGMR